MCLCQFHQRFTGAIFIQNFGAKNYKAALSAYVQNFGAKNTLLYKSHARKMLMKLTTPRAFRTKFFARARKMLMKLTHGRPLMNLNFKISYVT